MRDATKTSRRAVLAGSAALPFAAAATLRPAAAQEAIAAAPDAPKVPTVPTHRSIKLGDFEVTALLAGTNTRTQPHEIFGANASDETFAAVAEANFIPADKAQFFYTPTLVKTATDLVLFDTGFSGEGLVSALTSAGYSADDVTQVVITHMHGDHIGGLMTAGSATFANAAYTTGATEFDHWAAAGNDGFEANVRPLADRFSMINEGDSPVSGITAVNAFGHTPGMFAYMLESNGAQMLLGADFANHYVFSLAYPDWEVSFDTDKAQAAATRKRLLDMLATDRLPFLGYHMPFPAMGYVAKGGLREDASYSYVPASYQFLLDS
ncbi:ribonuclease Z [Aquimixticola soesokkakensis]|uniref:Ribonuclease Z n=1 Tax=Aquimixticola soesokkakensis TaxID=1519096 RepID=A0A1Y5S6X6_9RHOB|nr:MBL fold metallo-hydrolase [Aquimixticola soesokkakensis]SLN33359.1 ribonuclease Z [Aquimixticola soesokkakensis]